MSGAACIETRELLKRYGQTVVIDGLSLRIPAGQVVSIIGANGAGKSTLLTMIARLLPASGGTVWIDGADVSSAKPDALARRLGILRQDNHLAVRLTVRELVTFGRYPHSKGRTTAEDVAAVDDALRFLDLEPLAGRYLDELSGGQRQRAFVAMVLAQDTEYILLDEPLNNLDLARASSMMGLIRRLARERGKTVISVLHDVNFASAWSDSIIALRAGRVVAQGPPASVITAEVLREVYGTEVAIVESGGQRLVDYFT
ncbi:MAG: ATP-binding cassette domain-containing protein [Promicromonosporaceae bacterium]|nr:ATP-binding cassette domain-containing protein [Promicromonosporaceae bacterium]